METVLRSIKISETKHAFRVNGVAFEKKHLEGIFPGWTSSFDVFHRYLVLVPFLAETGDPERVKSEHGKYAIIKAKHIWDIFDVPEGGEIPFIMAALTLCGLDGETPDEDLQEIVDKSHDHICRCGKLGHQGHTVH